jgi:putative membrane-bound dehydrogenase-like protein
MMCAKSLLLVTVMLVALSTLLSNPAVAQVERPTDAPPPQSPLETANNFRVPPGFRLELVASEPLIREPSGLCWDERGNLFVCELHGYNLEGQYDIEELNKTGRLDRVVRRIQADERHKQAAEAETYGTIKRLVDSDGDGRMDQATVWADRLPPCLGICAVRNGIIAACQTQIVYLADRDGDGQAEWREVLFEGFKPGPLERSINCPQLGLDQWITFGRGAGGGTIRGKYLTSPVELPNTDFRIKSDGTAIEPILGNTGTMGFAVTDTDDRFVISTGTPGIFVAPIPWRYLARNPNAASSALQQNATSDQRVYPISQPHPWRVHRANDPGFAKLYTDRYGIAESAPNGYFTSACSPLVYEDDALPGLRGQLLACEPAQNMVHRAIIRRQGSRLTLHREPSELQSEFLTSSDSWFHAIALSHAPDGSIYVVDFYREIIEDYSAIPRYLQQQYGLMAGQDRGRIWRLTHDNIQQTPPADMSRLSPDQLAAEVGSPHYWRRNTARRLLVERNHKDAAPALALLVENGSPPATTHQRPVYTLDGLQSLGRRYVLAALGHPHAAVRRQGLRFSERWLDDVDTDEVMLNKVMSLASDSEALVRLQVALTLGESRQPSVVAALANLSRQSGNEDWMPIAVLSSVPQRGGELLAELLASPAELRHANKVIEPLCATIANRREPIELSQSIESVAQLEDRTLQSTCLRGLRAGLKNPVNVALSDQAKIWIKKLAGSSDEVIRQEALPLVRLFALETEAERRSRIDLTIQQIGDIRLSAEEQIVAVEELANEQDPRVTTTLLNAVPSSTPRVRDSIVKAILSHRDSVPMLLSAIESKALPASWLTAVQRSALLGDKEPSIRQRAATLFESHSTVNPELLASYVKALAEPRDSARGQQVFRDKCGTCHQAHGIGHAVGPDLNAEFQRAEETILKDVLMPSETISAGYASYVLLTNTGQVHTGLLGAETPTSLTIRMAEGKQETVLRKDIEELRAVGVSMMPEDMYKTVSPQELADLLSWLRNPPSSLVLVDENLVFADALSEGKGAAQFVESEFHAGRYSLRITPPQRYSPRIANWSFRIRENPAPGEYRYMRFAWKAADAKGIMLELAADGHWPSADKPLRRYHAGENNTGWQSLEVDSTAPREWTVVTRDLWQDVGDFTLTGLAPTAIGGAVYFDRVELLRQIEQ